MSTMMRLRTALLVGLLVAVPAALPQSGTEIKSHQPLIDLVRQFMPGYHPRVRQFAPRGAGETLDAVKIGLAVAKIYKFSTADYPGAALSVIFDTNAVTSVGVFQFNPSANPSTPQTAFTLTSGVYRTLLVPGSAMGSIATGINSTSEIVGAYVDASAVSHGYLDDAGVFTTVDYPGGTGTVLYDINSPGEMVGGFTDASGNTHGFLDNGGTFTQLDYPGAILTIATGINLSGEIVGQWEDAAFSDHGFIYNAGVFTDLDFPLAASTTAIGVNDAGEIAGYYLNTTGPFHGFLYSDGTFSSVDVSGASQTELARIKNSGAITGVFIDALAESHGAIGH